MIKILNMLKTRKFLAISLFVSLFTVPLGSQTTPIAQAADSNTTTVGYDFTVAFPTMLSNGIAPGESQLWNLYASSTQTGEISVSWATQALAETYTVTAGLVTKVPVDRLNTLMGPGDGFVQIQPDPGNMGQMTNHVHSTVPISLYACYISGFLSDCSNFYPDNTWGTRYRTLYNTSTFEYGIAASSIAITSGAQPTSVTITPAKSFPTKFGAFEEGVPITIQLQANEVWTNYVSGPGGDFSGTLFTSSAPISLSNGGPCEQFYPTFQNAFGGSCDGGFQVVPPVSSWGTSVYTNNFANNSENGSGYRILADRDNTNIVISGDTDLISHGNISGGSEAAVTDVTHVVLNAGEYYQFEAFAYQGDPNLSLVINSNNPILVAHYMFHGSYTSISTDPITGEIVPISNDGDPSMNYIVPFQQFLSDYTVVNPQALPIAFLNIVAPTNSLDMLRVDNLVIDPTLFRPITGTDWSTAQLKVLPGSHHLTNSQAFGVEAYGAGSFDSYAYVGGANTSNISAVRSLVISPSTFAGVVGQNVCIPIAVKDAYGSPVVGVRVDATISGASGSLNSNSIADSFGIAHICYTGTAVGADAISVSANSFSATAIVNWTSLAPLISYSPNTLDLDNVGAMPTITPTNTGGAATSWSSSPALPAGITLNATTGVISGTPTTIQSLTSYAITATNTSGSSTTTIRISISAGTAPVISYSPATVVGLLDTPLTAISPITTGTWPTWSITPSLPSGVRFNTQNGQITGTPGAQSAATIYTVTAVNNTASTTTTFTFSVQATPPVISFPTSTFTGTKNIQLNTITPRNLGSPVTTWSILPALPAGLNLNPANGSIFGTPTETSTATSYTVTGLNSAGYSSASFTLTIAASLAAPNISYSPSSLTALVGRPITTMLPTNTGGDASTWTISPNLPAGLIFSSSIGTIFGTPTETSTATAYTVTAFNATDSSTATVNIAVTQLLAPSISFNPNVIHGHVATPLTTVQATNSGGVASLWTVTPALPAGLSLNPINGSISGTPTTASTATVYSIFAQNIVDSSTATVTIDIAPLPAPVISYAASTLHLTTGNALSTLTPRNTGGAVATWGISTALPAGLSFNTSTGVISGTPTQVSAATSYLITATNAGGTSTVTILLDVNNPVIFTPDPAQTSTIASSVAVCNGSAASVVIKGNFISKIAKITINGVSIDSTLWVQTNESVTIPLGNRPAGTLEISLYNGQAPVLATQTVNYTGACTTTVATPVAPVTPVAPAPVAPAPTATATPKPKPTVAPIPMDNPSQGLKYIGSVYFATGSSKLTLESQKTLRAIASTLKASNTPQVLSLGNADIRGGVDNSALSKARAAAVISYLKTINPQPQYVLRWYGTTRPLGKTNSPSDLAKNRRVEIWQR
jgi:outer membrane protein OmpA-like peptidoglycan-associated protein